MKQAIVDGDITSLIKTEILPHVSLKYMFDMAVNVGQSLLKKKWDIYYIESGGRFVTSDTPVMFGDANSSKRRTVGPAHPETFVLCPVTKTMLIAARPYCDIDRSAYEFMPVKAGMVAAVNRLMCFTAQRFVYASVESQELLSCIKETKGYQKKLKAFRIGDVITSRWDVVY